MKLWALVDEYSFPVIVADSCKELAKLTGANEMTIRTIAYRNSTGEYKNGKFIAVECGEDETDKEVQDAVDSALQRRKKRLCVYSIK